MTLAPRSDAVSSAGRAAHDIGVAVLLGGNLFGRRAMHPALEWVSSPEERGKVVNAAWRRYGTFNSVALVAVVANWAGARLTETGDRFLTPRERRLARAKDVAVAAVAVTGVASAVEGVRFGRSAPGGAVPLHSGSEPAAETPPPAVRTKKLLNALGSASAVAEVALLAVNAGLAQENYRRPSARRLLARRY
jgi:pyruvate/2-oxoglutarate dehydrogenase complex dihydrolipoamide acyltransferase (E2) component